MELDRQRENYNLHIQELTEEIATLNSEVEISKEKVLQVSEKLAESENEIAKLQDEIEVSNKEKAKLEFELKQAQSHAESLQTAIQHMRNRTNELEDELKRSKDAASEELAKAETQQLQLRRELKETMQSLNHIKEDNSQLTLQGLRREINSF